MEQSARLLQAVVATAALFHDLGKATNLFQRKLRTRGIVPDLVRHEIVSTHLWLALTKGLDAGGIADLLETAGTPEFGRRFDAAFDMASAAATAEWQRFAASELKRSDVKLAADDPGAFDPATLRGAVALLILTHHRLFSESEDDAQRRVTTGANFRRREGEMLPPADLYRIGGYRIWEDGKWVGEASRVAGMLQEAGWAEDGRLLGLYEYGRLSLLLGDHYGSALKLCKSDPERWDAVLANTAYDEKRRGKHRSRRLAGDDLATHTQKVMVQSRRALSALTRTRNAFPGLSAEQVPSGLDWRRATTSGRFAWQGAASARIASAVAEAGGSGYFAALIGGTGSGKTRGAAMALAAAAFSDVAAHRRRLRYNLCLAPSALGLGAGREYLREIGYAADDVAVLIGGPHADREEDDETVRKDEIAVAQGSETERLALGAVVAPAGFDLETGEPAGADGPGRRLPRFFREVIARERDAPAMERLLSTPVVLAGLDHLMPAADARRGSHVMPTLRLATADTVVDDVDVYDGEDLAAIGRLAYLCGAYGRRFVVSSANVGNEAVTALREAYSAGWAEHARYSGGRDAVVFAVVGDGPELVQTRLSRHGDQGSDAVCREAFEAVARGQSGVLAGRSAMRRAEIVDPFRGADGLVDDETLWRTLYDGALALGQRHAATLDLGAGPVAVSVGLVRLHDVADVRAFHRWMIAGEEAANRAIEAGTIVRSVCHHERHIWISRSIQERGLARMLDRRAGGGAENDVMAREMTALGLGVDAAEAGLRRVLVLVVATAGIEADADLDFDFALVEPRSMRSVLRTAGLVRRHRRGVPDGANVAILSETLAGYRADAMRYGVETPIGSPGMATPRLEAVGFEPLAWPGLRSRPLDARIARDEDAGALAAAERGLVRAFLEAPYCPCEFSRETGNRFSAEFGRRRRFARPQVGVHRIFRHLLRHTQMDLAWKEWDPLLAKPHAIQVVQAKLETSLIVAPLFDHGDEVLDAHAERIRIGHPSLSHDVFASLILGTDIPKRERTDPGALMRFEPSSGFG